MKQKKINFLGVGPQRTGSTWLYEMLQNHADIDWPHGVKETFFFDQRFKKGWEWYYWHFKSRTRKIVGEIAPTYFDHEEAAQRIQQHSPDCKIIIGVRNPIEKTYSVFRHYHSLGEVPKQFDDAIKKFPKLINCGRYKAYSQMWIDLFGGDNVMFVLQDDIISDSQSTLDRVTTFLEIESISIKDPSEIVNSGGTPWSPKLVKVFEFVAWRLRSAKLHHIVNLGKSLGLKRVYGGGKPLPKLTGSQRKLLAETFAEDIRWLERHLSRDLSHWVV